MAKDKYDIEVDDKYDPFLSDGDLNHPVFNVKYNVDESEEPKKSINRPFGIVLISVTSIALTLLLVAYLCYLMLAKAGINILPSLPMLTFIQDAGLPSKVVELALFSLFYVSTGLLLWDGSKVGCSILLFLMALGMISSANIVLDFFNFVETAKIDEQTADAVYTLHTVKLGVHLFVMAYLYKTNVVKYFQLDRTGVSLRALVSILVVMGIIYGEKIVNVS